MINASGAGHNNGNMAARVNANATPLPKDKHLPPGTLGREEGSKAPAWSAFHGYPHTLTFMLSSQPASEGSEIPGLQMRNLEPGELLSLK